MEALRAHSAKHDRLAQEYQYLAPLKPQPQLADTSSLESLIADLVDAEGHFQWERACCRTLDSLASPPGLEDVSALAYTVRSLAGAERDFSRGCMHSATVKDLQPLPVLDDVEKLESLCRTLSCEEENHRKLKAKTVCLGLLNDPPVIDDAGPLERMAAALESAQLANGALCRQQRVLESLAPSPQLADPEPLAGLISQLEGTLQEVDRHKGLIMATAGDLAKLEADLRVAERAGAGSLLPGRAERRPRRRMLVGVSGLAGMAAVILLFILGSAWFNRPNTGSTNGTHEVVDLAAC
jgi:hypothetical protein